MHERLHVTTATAVVPASPPPALGAALLPSPSRASSTPLAASHKQAVPAAPMNSIIHLLKLKIEMHRAVEPTIQIA